MDKKALNKFKKILLHKQQEIHDLDKIGDEATQTVELDQSRLGRVSRMDALQGQAMSQEVKRRRQIELQKITVALKRMENNEYGYCVKCEEEIKIKRLELDPSALLCIECANKLEQN